MNVVTVKFKRGPRRSGWAQYQFSLGAWFSDVEQKDCQEGLFFNLDCTGQEASCCRENSLQEGKAFVESECLMFQRDFQRSGVSDSSNNSGAGVGARKPKITLKALL